MEKRSVKEQLLDCLLGAGCIQEFGILRCLACKWEIPSNDKHFNDKVVKHFQCKTHRELAGYKLSGDKTTGFTITHSGNQLSLKRFLEKQPQRPMDTANDPEHPVSSSSNFSLSLSVRYEDSETQTDITNLEMREKFEETEKPKLKRQLECVEICSALGLCDVKRVKTSHVEALRDNKCIQSAVKNAVVRGPEVIDGEPNRAAHNRSLKATVTKFGLKWGSGPAKDVSRLLGGPKGRTLQQNMQSKLTVADSFIDSNVTGHMENASEILKSRREGTENVPWIIAVDATATTGKFGIVTYGGQDYLIGGDHPYDNPTRINRQSNSDNSQLITEDGSINGFESAKKLIDMKQVKPAGLVSNVVLVPLCKEAFSYSLFTFPTGKGFTHVQLYELFLRVNRIGKEFGMDIIALAGDGDSRLRKMQFSNYINFTTPYEWLTKSEFPVLLGLGKLKTDIPMQDVVHCVKKLRNNAKYLSTRILLFCKPLEINMENRLKYAVTWEVIVTMWMNSSLFRDCVAKSSVALTDKQDPSAVTELCFTYPLLYEAGYEGMGLFLETIYLMVRAVFDKSLKPCKRMTYLSAAKTVFTLWKEAMGRLRIIGKHLLTKPTIDDVQCSLEGQMMYLVKLATEYKEGDVVPWFFTSDSCEQMFAFLRIGRHRGRRVQLDAASIIDGLNKANRSLELDADKEHFLDCEIAHTRGKALINSPLPSDRVYKGKEMTQTSLKKAFQDGVELGRDMFGSHTLGLDENDICSDHDHLDQEHLDSSDEDSDGDTDDENDALDLTHVGEGDESNIIRASTGRGYNLQAAVTHFCNNGRSNMPASTRIRRFQITQVISDKKLTVQRSCDKSDNECRTVCIGESRTFGAKDKTTGRKMLISGTVMYIAVGFSDYKSPDRSSVSWDPVTSACADHQRCIFWVQKKGGMVKCTKLVV